MLGRESSQSILLNEHPSRGQCRIHFLVPCNLFWSMSSEPPWYLHVTSMHNEFDLGLCRFPQSYPLADRHSLNALSCLVNTLSFYCLLFRLSRLVAF